MVYLKQLEVENFKSWRGRQVIGPFKRFNCIVGTNGSGKSNVMDALCFALGERAGCLRVKHARDLVHGAHIGVPVPGAAGVAVTFCEVPGEEEEEEEEKTFSRTITGDTSEYRINGTLVALSRYTSELQRLGIIVKARNCFVFQGAVESIAMMKPRERTQLFERISSSADLAEEYEAKKRATQKAEENAQFLYNRKKVVSVEQKEAKLEQVEAQKYQALAAAHERDTLQLHLCRLYYNGRSADGLSAALRLRDPAVEGKLQLVITIVRTIMTVGQVTESSSLRRGSIYFNKLCSSEQDYSPTALQYCLTSATTYQGMLYKSVEKRDPAELKVDRSFLQDSQDWDANVMTSVFLKGARWRRYLFIICFTLPLLKIQASLLNPANLQQLFCHLHILHKRASVFMDLQTADLQFHPNATIMISIGFCGALIMLQENIKHIQTQMEDYLRRAEKLEDYRTSCKCPLSRNVVPNSQGAQGNQVCHRISLPHSSALTNVRKEVGNHVCILNRQRVARCDRCYLIATRWFSPPNKFGRLFDLCHPIHKKYQLAVTKLFGKYLSAIVVTTERVAGRTFFSFPPARRRASSSFPPAQVRPLNERLREVKGAKMAVDVVQSASPPLKRAVQFVCGNGLVCETLKEARQIAFGGPERLKTVALDGTLFLKSGVISGGSSDLRSRARCWDEKEMDVLKEQRDRLTRELQSPLSWTPHQSPLSRTPHQSPTGDHTLGYSLSHIRSRHDSHHAELLLCFRAEFTSSCLLVVDAVLHLSKVRLRLRIVLFRHEKWGYWIEDAVFLDFCIEIGVANIREYEDEHIKQQQETDKKRLQFETQKTRLGTQLDYELEQLQKQRKKIQELEETIDQEERRIAEQKKVEDDLLRAVDEATAALLDLKNRLAAKTAEVNSAKEEAERRVKGLQEVSRQLGRMQKEVLSLETSVEQKKMERHNILLSCKILGLPIPFLSGSLDDISEVQVRAQSGRPPLRAARETGGPVFLRHPQLDSEMESGLEDGKEIQAQLERLEQAARAQEDVLKRSTAPNLKVLEKMCRVQEKFQEVAHEFEASRRAANKARLEFEQVKARRYQLFSQCFEHVCVAIDQIYKRLCRNTSAQAFLSPENPEEPYLEGINYNCVSPGKRFMPMDNLSGGEKSIAALALVFAVNSYRPAPFFVMDEVDAALDNTNIGKVTSYIREQSREDFQMIVISLKEEFYSQADSLLGVYPEFDGGMCSHILSLDLTPFPLT
uniref:Structural maintenance of chromosomes protein n=1 Tax=Lepisosteus oculatus TaxID=7918 RepID=W5NKF9_LEPOC